MLVTHLSIQRTLVLIFKKFQRLAKWFTTLSPKDKAKIIKDVSQLVLSRRTRMCNFLEYKGKQGLEYTPCLRTANPCMSDTKVVYRRYASLFFIAGCSSTDNELTTLEIVHRYVEQMDKYYGNVCELDIIFNFQKAYFILDELLLAGEMQESSKKNVLRCISQQDSLEDMEVRSISALRSLYRLYISWVTIFLQTIPYESVQQHTLLSKLDSTSSLTPLSPASGR